VRNGKIFSYTKYITQFGAMGGGIYFTLPSIDEKYVPGEIYAISFISQGEDCGWFCKGLKFVGYSPGDSPTVGLLSKLGLRRLAVGYAEATTPGGTELDSFMLLSQATHAAEMDCIIK
jgi:hypothetical protein